MVPASRPKALASAPILAELVHGWRGLSSEAIAGPGWSGSSWASDAFSSFSSALAVSNHAGSGDM